MELTIMDLVAVIMTAAGLASAFSLLYAKFIRPIKKVVKQVETNAENIKSLDEKISNLKTDRHDDDIFNLEVRAILFESLVSIHEGLEQLGCNHGVTDNKKKLIKFMSAQIGAKKPKNK